MADAPEVVSSSLQSEPQTVPSPATLPQETSPSENGAEVPPRDVKTVYGDEKQVEISDSIQPMKIVVPTPENEDAALKYAYEHDDRAGSGLESATAKLTPQEKKDRDRLVTIDPVVSEKGASQKSLAAGGGDRRMEQWHFGFWDCWNPGSLCIESLCCPCVLTGRTHQRLHTPDDGHFPSTNAYCTGCCFLSFATLGILPLFCFMTSAQRREIRYRYDIAGNNGEDCAKATFCVCCALVQEEKEVVWRENQKKVAQNQELERRDVNMEYVAAGKSGPLQAHPE